ncbi:MULTISPECIES: hypothetical protein [Bacillus]|uniref:Uncharacterized protein n=3 Tax=Bacillus thuringiensis TaxID=1428 RepID=A0AAP4QD09_BACTU|nr:MULTISPECIES: hypothetical protein [Bacillus]MEC2876706.1 hypothetical protein [Bacillus cereus]AEA15501.1 hypothetical protein CT43_CH1817 [Bacillus thuringiensis serovar chinensis CT-43]AFV17624.1 hypothetical protein BTB_c19320 [Bacillus thuringiensis Bt407]AGG00556.1 hypothetical protein H175_ch1843 [Bacillus thuringiensis serovar thuringiensis str. IS5056]ARP57245.1 hypothetical protein CAB88_09140 [Bacillus thuringiensis]
MEEKIDLIKEKLSNGKSRFENGKTVVEVGLSDLNELLSLAYDINNYRLNALWNLEQTSKACKEYEMRNEKYEESLKLIKGVTNGVDNAIVKDVNRIAKESLL